jgi:hypothetical protein
MLPVAFVSTCFCTIFLVVLAERASFGSIDTSPHIVLLPEATVTEKRTVNPKDFELRGCEVARKVMPGYQTDDKEDVFFWDCVRCAQGYLETLTHLTVKGTQSGEAIQVYQHNCEWRPWGGFCLVFK